MKTLMKTFSSPKPSPVLFPWKHIDTPSGDVQTNPLEQSDLHCKHTATCMAVSRKKNIANKTQRIFFKDQV